MKKLFLTLCALLLGGSVCVAQTTAVTATVVDSDTTVWAGAGWTLSFVVGPTQSNPAAYTIGGAPLDPAISHQTGVADGSGVITFTTYRSTSISPVQSTWNLQVCPNASAPCAIYNFSTSASTLNISTGVNSVITAPRFRAISGSYGYIDGEAVQQLVPGSTYWNVTSSVSRCYTGSAWGVCSASGGTYTLPIATTTVLGGVKPDGTNCTVDGGTGVLTCAGTSTGTVGSSGLTTGVIPVASGSQTIEDSTTGTEDITLGNGAGAITTNFGTTYQVNSPGGNVFNYTNPNLTISTSHDISGVIDGNLILESGADLDLQTDPSPLTNLANINIINSSSNAAAVMNIINIGGGGTSITDSGGGGIYINDTGGGGAGMQSTGGAYLIAVTGINLTNTGSGTPGQAGTVIEDSGGDGILINPSSSPTLTSSPGNIVINNLWVPGTIYSVAGTPLPACSAPLKGARAFVSDDTSNVYGIAYVGGAGTAHPVYCDGTNWITG